MDIVVYYRIIASIFGIGLPLLVNAIFQLDSKYKVDGVAKLFKDEKILKVFYASLILSVVMLFISSLNLTPQEFCGLPRSLLKDSREVVLLVATVFLVVSFLLLIFRISNYYTTLGLIKILKKKLGTPNLKQEAFESLLELLRSMVRENRHSSVRYLTHLFYDQYYNLHPTQNSSLLDKRDYYSLVRTGAIELCKSPHSFIELQGAIYGCGWIYPNSLKTKMTFDDYQQLWFVLLEAVKSDKVDFLKHYWESYYSRLNNYSVQNRTMDLDSSEEIDRLKHFNLMFGGLMLSKGYYSVVDHMLSYRMSNMADLISIPINIETILSSISKFMGDHDPYFDWIEVKFPWPHLSGIAKEDKVRYEIHKYLALLYCRWWATNIDRTAGKINLILDRPESLHALNERRLALSTLLSAVEIIYSDDSIRVSELEKVKNTVQSTLFSAPEEWLLHQIELLESVQEELEVEAEIADDKAEVFRNRSNLALARFVEDHKLFLHPNEENTTIEDHVNGTFLWAEKKYLVKKPSIENVSLGEFPASLIVRNMRTAVSSLLRRATLDKNTFLLSKEELSDLFSCTFLENVIIVRYELKQNVNTSNTIIDLNSTDDRFRGIFLVRRSDLPTINFLDIKDVLENQFDDIQSLGNLNLYTSITDLNKTSEEKRSKFNIPKRVDDVKKMAILGVHLSMELKRRPSPQIIQLRLFDDFRDNEQNKSTLEQVLTNINFRTMLSNPVFESIDTHQEDWPLWWLRIRNFVLALFSVGEP